MRVLFDHQIFSYQTFGGASRYYCELMAAFTRAGSPQFDLAVATSPNTYLAKAEFYRGRHRERPSGRTGVVDLFATYARNELAARWLARRGDHDLVHATFYDPSVLGQVGRRRLVVTVLDMIPERYPEFFDTTSLYGRAVTARWIAGKRTLCARADAILAISERTKQDVVEHYRIPADRITVTHLASDLRPTSAPRPDGWPGRYVLYVGTRNTYKNWQLFIEAMARVIANQPDLGVVCIGGGGWTADERALLDRHQLGNVVIQRNASERELAASYQHAAAFVFPSRYEGFGIPILEAFACECPVVLADASCFPEIAGDAASYFDPDDRDQLVDAIARLTSDRTYADELRARGRIRARAFSWDATATATIAAYRGIA